MDNFITADYLMQDDQYTVPVLVTRRTSAELTALTAAKALNPGMMYFDTTTSTFKLASDQATLTSSLTTAGAGSAVVITGGTINGTTVGATTRAAGSFTSSSTRTV